VQGPQLTASVLNTDLEMVDHFMNRWLKFKNEIEAVTAHKEVYMDMQ
jgi:hypothetical protein